MRTKILTAMTVLALLVPAACTRGEKAPLDSAASAQPTPQTESTPQPVDEIQTLSDSVQVTIDRDTAAAARSLRAAAASARRQAAQANENAKAALTKSADELDSLAASVSRRAERSAAAIDSAFARLRIAESLNDVTEAIDAWATQQRTRAGEALEKATDEFERASAHVNSTLDSAATQVSANARAMANRVKQNAEVADAEFRRVANDLETQVRKLGDRLPRPKSTQR